jgi:hypothetical protein
MTRQWHNPDRAPTPADLSAWADGELDADRAAQVESWLADHPQAAAEADAARRIVGLYRAHPPAEPSPDAWLGVRQRIDAALAAPAKPSGPWRTRWPWFLAVTLTAAAMLGGVLLAGALMPWHGGKPDDSPRVILPPEDDNEEPFAVASASEVHIISMDVRDADRVLMGQPLLGPFEFVSGSEIELVKVEPDWEEGTMPKLQRGDQVPMVIVAPAEDDDDQS